MTRLTVNTETGLVWIDGHAVPVSQSIAKLIEILAENKDQIVKHADLEAALNISENTRYAYLRDARKVVGAAGLRIRSVFGEGVVLEEIPAEVAV